MKTSDFDYDLPPEFIAQLPSSRAIPRDRFSSTTQKENWNAVSLER